MNADITLLDEMALSTASAIGNRMKPTQKHQNRCDGCGRTAPDCDIISYGSIEKIRRALSVKHIREGELGVQIADHQVVRGRIEWDAAENGRVPILVIDGREFTWDEFGHMVMTFEGWQFKLEIRDQSEEV